MDIKLLLVDDEELTRKGILQYTKWSDIGISHVKGAANGLDALDILEEFQPDILLTDIKMPHMSGIELAKKVRERAINCHIIFISGYAEKEYLKSAIDLKVEAYIDKPVTPDAISKVVSEVVTSICRERENKLHNILLEQNIGQADDIVRGQIAHLLIEEQFDYEGLCRSFSPSWFNWPMCETYNTVCLHLFLPNMGDFNFYRIRHYWSQYHLLKQEQYYSNVTQNNTVFFIVSGVISETLTLIVQKLREWIFSEYHLESQATYGPCVNSLNEISHSYQRALHTIHYAQFYCIPPSILREPTRHELTDYSVFSDLKEMQDYDRLFDMLFEKKYTNIEQLKQQLFRLYLQNQHTQEASEAFEWEHFSRLSLQECRDAFKQFCQSSEILLHVQEPKINQAIQYIHDNYHREDLSIKMIADHIELSQNYFCTLFKQHAAMTVNEFIIRLRLEKTKYLLTHTNLKLYEISHQVGIPDANYLNLLFKKAYQITPSQFRKNS